MLVTPSKVIQPYAKVRILRISVAHIEYREHCLGIRSFVARLALLMSSRKVDIIAISSHELEAQTWEVFDAIGNWKQGTRN